MTSSDALSLIFAALADSTRREILTRLAKNSATVGDVAKPFKISAPAISQHLKVLERAGLIERTTNGKWRTLTMRPEALNDASQWVEKHRREWGERFDLLEQELEAMKQEEDQ